MVPLLKAGGRRQGGDSFLIETQPLSGTNRRFCKGLPGSEVVIDH